VITIKISSLGVLLLHHCLVLLMILARKRSQVVL
jgi:hypothetical protein